MAQHNHHHAPDHIKCQKWGLPHTVTETYYAPPVMAYPPQGPNVAPLPAGYPTMDVSGNPQNSSPIETKTRGEGFWKGCVAAICCCWVVEFCCGC